jgi:predicted PolB exonuclease-like 3'-5' exonuclease
LTCSEQSPKNNESKEIRIYSETHVSKAALMLDYVQFSQGENKIAQAEEYNDQGKRYYQNECSKAPYESETGQEPL